MESQRESRIELLRVNPPLIPAKKIRLFASGIRNTRRHISRKKKKRRRKKHIYLQSKLRTFSLSPCARANIILQYSIRTLPSFLLLCFRAEKEEEKGERKEKIHFQAGKAQKSLKNATFAQQNKPHNVHIASSCLQKMQIMFFHVHVYVWEFSVRMPKMGVGRGDLGKGCVCVGRSVSPLLHDGCRDCFFRSPPF